MKKCVMGKVMLVGYLNDATEYLDAGYFVRTTLGLRLQSRDRQSFNFNRPRHSPAIRVIKRCAAVSVQISLPYMCSMVYIIYFQGFPPPPRRNQVS